MDIRLCLQNLPEKAGYGTGTEHPTENKVTKFSEAKFLKVLFLVLICLSASGYERG